MVLDAVCDENGVESVQLCSWWSNGVNESSGWCHGCQGHQHQRAVQGVSSRGGQQVLETGCTRDGGVYNAETVVLHKVMTDSARTGYRAAGLAAEATR